MLLQIKGREHYDELKRSLLNKNKVINQGKTYRQQNQRRLLLLDVSITKIESVFATSKILDCTVGA